MADLPQSQAQHAARPHASAVQQLASAATTPLVDLQDMTSQTGANIYSQPPAPMRQDSTAQTATAAAAQPGLADLQVQASRLQPEMQGAGIHAGSSLRRAAAQAAQAVQQTPHAQMDASTHSTSAQTQQPQHRRLEAASVHAGISPADFSQHLATRTDFAAGTEAAMHAPDVPAVVRCQLQYAAVPSQLYRPCLNLDCCSAHPEIRPT